MNRLVVTIILGLLVVAGAVVGINGHNAQVAKLEYELGRERLRTQYIERASGVHGQANSDRRGEELASLTKWYNAEIQSLSNLFPGQHDPDASIKEAEAQSAAPSNGKKAGDLELRKEFATETKGLYDTILKSRYKPVATAVLEGVRFDILSIRRAQDEGHSRLRIDAVLWGAPTQLVEREQQANKTSSVKKQLNFGFKGLDFKFFDAKETLLGGGSTGAPRVVIEAPERWFGDFPPQAVLAVWYIDPLPETAEQMSLAFAGEIKSPSAGPLPVSNEWELKVDSAWRVQAGEKFEGEQRLMPEEDLKRSSAKK